MDWPLNWNISKYLGISARTPNTGRARMMRPINFESFPSKPASCSSPKRPQRAPNTKQGRGWESSCYFCLWGHKIQADLAEFGFELMETGRAESECCSFLLQSFPQLSTQNLRMEIHWFRIPENLIPATADFSVSCTSPQLLSCCLVGFVGWVFLATSASFEGQCKYPKCMLRYCPISATYFWN